MGQKDLLEKRIMSRPEVFAEAYNVFVFNGRNVIRPEGLQPVNTVHIYDDGRRHEVLRDILRKYTDPIDRCGCYLGMENQECHTKRIPLKNMGYDRNSLSEQMRKVMGEGLQPVYTLFLNRTKHRWKSPLDLADMYTKKEKDRFREIIRSYPVLIINMMYVEDEKIMYMETELKQICRILKCFKDRKRLEKLIGDPLSDHLSADTADLINIKMDLKLRFREEEREKGDVNMCRAWEEIKREEYKKGAENQKKKDAEQMSVIKAEYENREQKMLEEIRKLQARLSALETG